MNQQFRPHFPSVIYDKDELKKYCVQAGYTEIEIANQRPIELLHEGYVTENFYLGWQDSLTTNQTFNFNSMDEKTNYDYICFGVANEKLRPYIFEELIDIFGDSKRFINTVTGENYSPRVINKLKLLANREQDDDESISSYQMRRKLGETINFIDLLNQDSSQIISKFARRYEDANSTIQKIVQDALAKLLAAAMYMRGWDGVKPYPIKEHQTLALENDEIRMATQITDSLIDFEVLSKQTPEYLSVQTLPLMIYRQDAFSISQETSEGLTIGDRIEIIRHGFNGGVQSCIRLSSNYLLTSVYYYMKYLNLDPKFEIQQIDHIS